MAPEQQHQQQQQQRLAWKRNQTKIPTNNMNDIVKEILKKHAKNIK